MSQFTIEQLLIHLFFSSHQVKINESSRAIFKYENEIKSVEIIDLKLGRSLNLDHVYKKEMYWSGPRHKRTRE